MSRSNRKTGAPRDRTNLYSEITDKIITELGAGRVPWVQPWGTAAAKAPLRPMVYHPPARPPHLRIYSVRPATPSGDTGSQTICAKSRFRSNRQAAPRLVPLAPDEGRTGRPVIAASAAQ